LKQGFTAYISLLMANSALSFG